MTYNYKFPMTSTTATFIIIHRNSTDPDSASYCIGKRSATADIYQNQWCIPGGFLNAKYLPENLPGEDVETTVVREGLEEVGVKI